MPIRRHEVQAAASLAFPTRLVKGMTDLSRGFDFVVNRVDFESGPPVVFRRQHNRVSPYEGPIDYGAQLIGEKRFYNLVPHLPVPRALYIEPDPSVLGFPFGFFTYMTGTPLTALSTSMPVGEVRRTDRELGRLLATIHGVKMQRSGRLFSEGTPTWGEYFSERLAKRLSPYMGNGIISSARFEQLVGMAAEIDTDQPRLLHLDFRYENILAIINDGLVKITGIVDAANCLAGDPQFELARLEEGVGLSPSFVRAFESHRGPVARKSTSFTLYRLETAALLNWVYRDSPHNEYRMNRLRRLMSDNLLT